MTSPVPSFAPALLPETQADRRAICRRIARAVLRERSGELYGLELELATSAVGEVLGPLLAAWARSAALARMYEGGCRELVKAWDEGAAMERVVERWRTEEEG